MKKIIIPLLLVLLMTTSVLAWGASRTVSGSEVTVTIDPAGGTGVFTIQETVSQVTITSTPAGCGLAGSVLTCDYDEANPQTFVYQTSGSGTVSGTIAGGYPSENQTITGDTIVPSAQDDCVAGLVCIDDGSAAAYQDAGCSISQIIRCLDGCQDGACIEAPACVVDVDCASGFVCQTGQCVEEQVSCTEEYICQTANSRALQQADCSILFNSIQNCPGGCEAGVCLEVDPLDSFLEIVRVILSSNDTQLQKISGIASALRDFFNG